MSKKLQFDSGKFTTVMIKHKTVGNMQFINKDLTAWYLFSLPLKSLNSLQTTVLSGGLGIFAVNASGLVAFTAADNLPYMLANQETIFTPLSQR